MSAARSGSRDRGVPAGGELVSRRPERAGRARRRMGRLAALGPRDPARHARNRRQGAAQAGGARTAAARLAAPAGAGRGTAAAPARALLARRGRRRRSAAGAGAARGGRARPAAPRTCSSGCPASPTGERRALALQLARTIGGRRGRGGARGRSPTPPARSSPIPASPICSAPDALAEAPIAAVVAGGAVVSGTVDRLLVAPDRILVADFKTGRDPPADAGAIPAAHLRQMAAYRAALRVIFPDRPVEAALLYTAAPVLHRAARRLARRAYAAQVVERGGGASYIRRNLIQENVHGHHFRHRFHVPGRRARRLQAGARRFLGGMVRPVQDDRALARGAERGARRPGDHRQAQHRRQSRGAGPLRRARHPDHDPVQGRRSPPPPRSAPSPRAGSRPGSKSAL